MSATVGLRFKTKKEESDYGFQLIMELIELAKQGLPYKNEIRELYDLAERNDHVKTLMREMILSLARENMKDEP